MQILMEAMTDSNRTALSIAACLRDATGRLTVAGVDSPRLNAEVLLASACGLRRAELLARLGDPVDAPAAARFAALTQRRLRREPLQYIVGSTELWSLDFQLTPDVLIPRPETERLVELVLELLRPTPYACPEPRRRALRPTICDVGTGSGCIAVALAHELSNATITALDVSPAALRLAAANAARCGVAERVRCVESDLLAAVTGERFDVIVSNPPYVTTSELDAAQPELSFEPRRALDGGADGLGIIRRLLAEARLCLKDDGWLFVEIGSDQGETVLQLARDAGARRAEVFNDYAGLPRVLRQQW
jgi:release factor glutamine methyltransferase